MLVASESAALRVLRDQPRAEPQGEIAVDALDLLFGRVDARGTAALLVGLDPARDVGEARGEIVIADGLIGELRAAADQRAFDAVERRGPGGIDADGEDDRGTVAIGEQARRAFGEDRRVEPGLAIGEVQRFAARPGFAVDRAVVIDEPGDIGDRIMEQEVAPGALDREGLVEIGRGRGIERDEGARGAVDMVGRGAARGLFGGGEHGGRKRGGDLEFGADRGEPGGERVLRIDQRLHVRPPASIGAGRGSATRCSCDRARRGRAGYEKRLPGALRTTRQPPNMVSGRRAPARRTMRTTVPEGSCR